MLFKVLKPPKLTYVSFSTNPQLKQGINNLTGFVGAMKTVGMPVSAVNLLTSLLDSTGKVLYSSHSEQKS